MAFKGHKGVVGLLVDQGTDISAADRRLQTPLHLASERGYEAIARHHVDETAVLLNVSQEST
jgi:ankyrin repeat protein